MGRRSRDGKGPTDFTLKLSADAEKARRLPKSTSLHLIEAEEERLHSENDFSSDNDENDNHDSLANKKHQQQQQKKKKKKKKTVKEVDTSHHHDFDVGISYPYDLWSLIGGFILPETVGTFAAICRDSYAVTHQASFWLRLWREYARGTAEEKPRLAGLMPFVVRSLFLKYEPFTKRMASPLRITDPHNLIGLTCVNQVCRGIPTCRGHVRFGFKFCKINAPKTLWASMTTGKSSSRSAIPSQPPPPPIDFEDLLRGDGFLGDRSHGDIFDNPDQNTCLLTLDAASYSLMPHWIVGMKLQKVCLTATGPGFRYQKMTLTFVPQHVGLKQSSCDQVTLCVGDVVSMKIWNWFHPSFDSML